VPCISWWSRRSSIFSPLALPGRSSLTRG